MTDRPHFPPQCSEKQKREVQPHDEPPLDASKINTFSYIHQVPKHLYRWYTPILSYLVAWSELQPCCVVYKAKMSPYTPKRSIITKLVRISAISGELLSSNGPITFNLHIYCRWGSVVWIFYVGKLSKGDDDSEHEFTNNLHSNNRCMYVGMWRDEAFHWQKIQSSSLSMVMNWHSIWFYILMNRIGRIYEGNTQATS